MRHDESTYPQDWKAIAQRDLDRSQRMLADDDPQAAGFYLQQALEKHLKSFLLARGWALKRIHDLEVLLNDTLPFDPSLEEFRPLCQTVTAYYMVDRYPLAIYADLTTAEIEEALTEGQRLIARLES